MAGADTSFGEGTVLDSPAPGFRYKKNAIFAVLIVIHPKMKKLLLALSLLLFSFAVNAQMSLAVMEFRPGSNMESNLSGLSDMLINSLFDSGNYDIVERSQIDHALNELNLQGKTQSVAELTRLGEYLKVDYVLVGTVNFIVTGNSSDPGFREGEYNIDVRIVNVKTARIVATAGVVKKSAQTYRSLMPDLAKQLNEKLNVSAIPRIEGYLYVYPERIQGGTYDGACQKAKHLNSIAAFGKDNWRLPTPDELWMVFKSVSQIGYTLDNGQYWSSEYHAVDNRARCEYCGSKYYPEEWVGCSNTRGILLVATD